MSTKMQVEKDNLLIKIINSEDCSVFDAIKYTVEDYVLNPQFTVNCSRGFDTHFEKSCLPHFDSSSGRKISKFSIETSESLRIIYNKVIKDKYLKLRLKVFELLKELTQEGEIWNEDYFCSFSDWVSFESCSIYEQLDLFDWDDLVEVE